MHRFYLLRVITDFSEFKVISDGQVSVSENTPYHINPHQITSVFNIYKNTLLNNAK